MTVYQFKPQLPPGLVSGMLFFAVVVVGNYRSQTDLRKKPRRQFHYKASLHTGPKAEPLPCAVLDISESGARITLSVEDELPKRFMLVLTKNGQMHRWCRVVWREGSTVGIEFVSRPAADKSRNAPPSP